MLLLFPVSRHFEFLLEMYSSWKYRDFEKKIISNSPEPGVRYERSKHIAPVLATVLDSENDRYYIFIY